MKNILGDRSPKSFLVQLYNQQCRCKHKWHSKHPRVKPMERRVFDLVTAPIYPEMLKIPTPSCMVKIMEPVLEKRRKEAEDNEFEKFLLKKCEKVFNENRIVLICQPKSMKLYEKKEAVLKWKRKGFVVHYLNNTVVRKFTENSKWVNIEPLLFYKNVYITAPSEDKMSDIFRVLKKAHEYILLGGFVNDTLYTKAGLERLVGLPTSDILLGQTVGILNTAASKTRSLLSSHQQTLSQNLGQYVADQQKDSSKDSS